MSTARLSLIRDAARWIPFPFADDRIGGPLLLHKREYPYPGVRERKRNLTRAVPR